MWGRGCERARAARAPRGVAVEQVGEPADGVDEHGGLAVDGGAREQRAGLRQARGRAPPFHPPRGAALTQAAPRPRPLPRRRSKEAAIAFVERQGWSWEALQPHKFSLGNSIIRGAGKRGTRRVRAATTCARRRTGRRAWGAGRGSK